MWLRHPAADKTMTGMRTPLVRPGYGSRKEPCGEIELFHSITKRKLPLQRPQKAQMIHLVNVYPIRVGSASFVSGIENQFRYDYNTFQERKKTQGWCTINRRLDVGRRLVCREK